jgi:hypothetical protein
VSFIPGGFGKLIDAAIPAKDAIDQIYASGEKWRVG